MNESHSRNVGYRERNMSQNLIQCYRGRLFRYEDAPLVLLSNKKKKKPISPSITRNIWYITPIKMQLVQVENSTLCRMYILNHLDLRYMCLGGKTYSFGILPAFAGTQSFLRQVGFCSCVREAFKSRASKINNKKVNRQKNPFGYDPEQWLPLLSFWTSDVIIRIRMISWAECTTVISDTCFRIVCSTSADDMFVKYRKS